MVATIEMATVDPHRGFASQSFQKAGSNLAMFVVAFAGSRLVQHWVQVEKEKWLPISCKRHQIGRLDFCFP